MALHFPTRAERPGKLPHAESLAAPDPAFMNQGSVLKRLFGRMVAEYAEFLFYAWDDEREEVIGVGHAIPAAWDGDRASLPDGGFDAVIEARFAPEPPTPTVRDGCRPAAAMRDSARSESADSGASTNVLGAEERLRIPVPDGRLMSVAYPGPRTSRPPRLGQCSGMTPERVSRVSRFARPAR